MKGKLGQRRTEETKAARSDQKTERKEGWEEMFRRRKRKNGVWDSREGGEVKVIQCRDM